MKYYDTNPITVWKIFFLPLFLHLLIICILLLFALWEQRITNDLIRQQNEFLMMEEPKFPETQEMEFTISGYTARKQETNSEPHMTATMEKPVPGWTCAVSRDYIHWLGGRIYIPDIGVRKINDLMDSRHTQQIDLVFGKVSEARQFGKQTRTVIYLGKS